MQLALRKDAPTNATLWQRFACWAIRARLVSQYSHGGIVIKGALYHATSANGLHKLEAGEWSPENWDLFDIGGDNRAALALFEKLKGVKYDWFSLLAFVGIRAHDTNKFYCFEWCYYARTLASPDVRITPEILLTFRGDHG